MTSHPEATHGTGYDADLAVRFTYHQPTPEQPEVYSLVRDLAHLLALLIQSTTASSREQSLALTHTEEAVMWANASIARRGLSAAGIAGASDLLEHVTQQYLAAKPDTLLAGFLSDTQPPDTEGPTVDAFDPWPPDGHVHPALEPLPASRHVPTLRSGLGLIASGHHVPERQPSSCPGCIAQRVLDGEPVDLPRYDLPDEGPVHQEPEGRPDPPATLLSAGLTAIMADAMSRGDHRLAAYANSVLAGDLLPLPEAGRG